LLTVAAPRRSDDKGLSFVGAVFESRIVARVRVISGDTPIGPMTTALSPCLLTHMVPPQHSMKCSRGRLS
jgi:hypothetical protein